jgi:hypothetical protein
VSVLEAGSDPAPRVPVPHRPGRSWRAEDGGSSGSWAVQALVVLALVGLVGYDAVAVFGTTLRLDTGAREVAREARDAYRASNGSLEVAADSAVEAAVVHEATVREVARDGEELTVTLERRAPTVVVHRIGPLAHWADRVESATVPLELR